MSNLESLKSEIENLLSDYLIYGTVSIKIETEPRIIEFEISTCPFKESKRDIANKPFDWKPEEVIG